MTQTNLAITAAELTPSQFFSQSLQQVQTYASTLANLSLTGDSNIDPVLSQCKDDASKWYVTIYPSYLNMPNTMGMDAPAIDNGLLLLAQLNNQLKSNPGSVPIRSSIDSEAASLQQTIKNIQQQTSALAAALNAFNATTTNDNIQLTQGLGKLNSEFLNIGVQINQQYGNLHSLENATCPNDDEINTCKNLINQLTAQYSKLANTINTVSNLIGICQGALHGLMYLSSFWQSAASDAANCMAALIQLQRDPNNLLALDIENNQSQWNLFKQFMQQVDITAKTLLRK